MLILAALPLLSQGQTIPLIKPESPQPASPSSGMTQAPAAAAVTPNANPPGNWQQAMPPPPSSPQAVKPTVNKADGGSGQAMEAPKPAAPGAAKASIRDIKDPTGMSPRFQQAMKQMVPNAGGKGGNAADKISIPKIRLAGKSLGGKGGATAMLQIEDRPPFLVRAGSQFSVSTSSSGDSLTIRVDSIDETSVQLVILPNNKRLFIN
jgi:hypothetical protein